MKKGSINDYIERNFSDMRKNHTYAVGDTAVKLAIRYGESVEKAETAALFHDMFRGLSAETLNYYVKELGLDKKYMNNPNLAHSKLGAIVMERDYGISDRDIINAVGYHTTGRAGMSCLEKIIYLADAIEPGRAYPGVERLREMAFDGLDEACLAALAHSMAYIKGNGLFLDSDTEEAIADLENNAKA